MNFVKHRRSGISTIISTMVILSGVAILGATMVTWSYSNTTSRENVLATAASTRTNAFNEFLAIENVWFCKGGSNPEPCHTVPINNRGINVTLTNVGSIGLNVTQITLATTVQNKITTNVFSIKNVALSPNQDYMWGQNYTRWQSKVPVTITVTTARGSVITSLVTPP